MGTYYPSHNYGPEHAASLAAAATHSAPTANRPKRKLSEAQLRANRENSKKSTGPITPEGKAICAMNAFRHGVTGQISAQTAEDRAARDRFVAPLIADLHPEGAIENQIAFLIAEGHWRLNRIASMEDNIFALGHYGPAGDLDVENPELHGALTSARVFLDSSKAFDRLTLYEQRIQRGISKHMQELEALQEKRKAVRLTALDEAAKLLQVADFNDEEEELGSEFSTAEIRSWIHRKERLKAAAWHDKHYWNPEIEFPLYANAA